jgi:hypothetical protein
MNDFNATEAALFREEPEDAAKRIIRVAAPYAAQAISAMAVDDTIAPATRLNAARYIIDRNLGPVGKDEDKMNELEAFLQEINREANNGH